MDHACACRLAWLQNDSSIVAHIRHRRRWPMIEHCNIMPGMCWVLDCIDYTYYTYCSGQGAWWYAMLGTNILLSIDTRGTWTKIHHD